MIGCPLGGLIPVESQCVCTSAVSMLSWGQYRLLQRRAGLTCFSRHFIGRALILTAWRVTLDAHFVILSAKSAVSNTQPIPGGGAHCKAKHMA